MYSLSDFDFDLPHELIAQTPLPERSWAHGNTLPDRISLYQRPIEAASEDHEDVIVCIAETLIHEIGHYFGLSEEEIEAIEDHRFRPLDFVHWRNAELDFADVGFRAPFYPWIVGLFVLTWVVALPVWRLARIEPAGSPC